MTKLKGSQAVRWEAASRSDSGSFPKEAQTRWLTEKAFLTLSGRMWLLPAAKSVSNLLLWACPKRSKHAAFAKWRKWKRTSPTQWELDKKIGSSSNLCKDCFAQRLKRTQDQFLEYKNKASHQSPRRMTLKRQDLKKLQLIRRLVCPLRSSICSTELSHMGGRDALVQAMKEEGETWTNLALDGQWVVKSCDDSRDCRKPA